MSPSAFETVLRLTSPELPISQRRIALREFALLNGWRPSDQMDGYPGTERFANGHLVVEHGLDNSAVISFLRADSPFSTLNRLDQNRLLCISYNNMVDWHVFPDQDGATFVYNRVDPPFTRRVLLSEQADSWRAEAFDRITGRKPNPNIKSLENALMDTISWWKRSLSIEMGKEIPNDSVATLFNAIIFVRALEDYHTHRTGENAQQLIECWFEQRAKGGDLTELLTNRLKALNVEEFPNDLLDKQKLKVFHKLDFETISRLLRDFYNNRFAPIYQYDFSLMSKHALSRIYEHYVSLLRTKDSPQQTFFPDLPNEEKNKATGAVYTPQYIARFFARYLKENLTPKIFRQLSTCDPACGSGIFLRTLLEMQCDPLQDINPQEVAETCFPRAFGIDVDPNACQASKLSLSLLYLVLTGKIPKKLNIVNNEAIDRYVSHKQELCNHFDVLIGNPPFVKWDLLGEKMKERVAEFMKDYSAGKIDMFLPILKIAMDMLKPDGLLLFVLPHSFLLAKNAKQLRKEILDNFWIRFLGDISGVQVFGETGAYVILLVLQKKNPQSPTPIPTTVLQCRDFIGAALQDVIEGKLQENDFYSIFIADQKALTADAWSLVKPTHSRLQEKLSQFTLLDEFLDVQEGFVTGADSIFIRFAHEIPKEEKAIYVPFLADRGMERFCVPRKVVEYVFYPFIEGRKIKDRELREQFPKTWEYLKLNGAKLKERSSVKAGQVPWWCPHRPVPALKMLRPKLVSPHLILMPRFSLDIMGKYTISRSPWLVPKDDGMGEEMLKYFLAVLNSSVAYWQIVQTSHKYSRGYAMLEKKTLKSLRVPNPKDVEPAMMKKLLKLVEKRLDEPNPKQTEAQIDELVSQLYGLSEDDRQQIGMEEDNGIRDN
jgi:type I restriction-modification system DNA methylase subunit